MRSIDCVRDRLGVVEEPVQAIERDVLVDPLEDVERARDRLVIGRVQPPRPAVLARMRTTVFELAFHLRRHVGPRLAEILEIGSGEDQHLAGAVVAEIIVPCLYFEVFVQLRKSSFSPLGFWVKRL